MGGFWEVLADRLDDLLEASWFTRADELLALEKHFQSGSGWASTVADKRPRRPKTLFYEC